MNLECKCIHLQLCGKFKRTRLKKPTVNLPAAAEAVNSPTGNSSATRSNWAEDPRAPRPESETTSGTASSGRPCSPAWTGASETEASRGNTSPCCSSAQSS